jgi:hypothetical protein
MSIDARQRLLQVIHRFGRAEVGRLLEVPLVVLDDWISGAAQMPVAKEAILVRLTDQPD